jgi:transcription initiation factor TFIIIB Brf1 subunit/transcription initiation factor TFIIB
MNCPRCGNEMVLDYHRKIPLNMCYNCGYIEGRTIDDSQVDISNFDHLRTLNVKETAAFLSERLKSRGINIDADSIETWLLSSKIRS